MPNRGINFVFERQKNLSQSQLQDRRIFKWSLIGFGVVTAIFIICLSVRIYFVLSVKKIIEGQDAAKQIILTHEKTERDYNIFANKLKQLSTLFGQRKNKQDALVFFSEIFGSVASVSGIDYSAVAGAGAPTGGASAGNTSVGDREILTFTIQTENIFDLNAAVLILKQPNVTQAYPDISKSNLFRLDDGSYSLNLTVSLEAPTP